MESASHEIKYGQAREHAAHAERERVVEAAETAPKGETVLQTLPALAASLNSLQQRLDMMATG